MWLNGHLKKMGQAEVNNLNESLKSGVIIISVLEYISGKRPPMYSKNPMVVQQKMDNWQVAVKYMRKLGIQVDDDSEPVLNDDGMPVESTGLNASSTFPHRCLLRLLSSHLLTVLARIQCSLNWTEERS